MTRSLRLAGLAGLAAAALGVAADLLMQLTADSRLVGRGQLDALLASVPTWRLWAGADLGLVAFVLAGAGVWHAHAGLAGAPRLARVFLVSGLLAYAWGAAFHLTFLFRGLLDHSAAPAAGELRTAFQQAQLFPVAASAAMLLVASAAFAGAVARGRTAYPRWAAALSPAALYALLTVAAYAVPGAGVVLAPVTFSLMSVLFFGSCVALART